MTFEDVVITIIQGTRYSMHHQKEWTCLPTNRIKPNRTIWQNIDENGRNLGTNWTADSNIFSVDGEAFSIYKQFN